MSDKAKPEFSLDQFSEAETDEEFGLPEFKEHFADTLTPAVLRDWTAKDFASIYVRFRPHLERHARRFLVNPSQVEEVVQDAFLYLMTTLPELDSELGVLKFLKWKVRLLSLDVIRANSRASISPLEELPDIESDEPETSQGLERAEDAAIVSMALAKLQPRQREALIATLYEEKSTEVAASQMGLSENAFRQLLFRSRAAFRKALVGEAETAGLTVSEILSLAARKAREGGYKSALSLALVVALSVSAAIFGAVFPTGPNTGVQMAFEEEGTAMGADDFVATREAPKPDSQPSAVGPADQTSTGIENLSESFEQQTGASVPNLAPDIQDTIAVSVQVPTDEQVAQLFLTEQANSIQLTSESSLDQLNGSIGAQRAGSDLALTLQLNETVEMSVVVTNSDSRPEVSYMWLLIQDGNLTLNAAPKVISQQLSSDDGSYLIELAATDLVVGDLTGEFEFSTTTNSKIFRSGIRMALRFQDGQFTGLEDLQVLDRGPAA